MKLKSILAVGILFFCNIANAQVVTVDGTGINKEAATRDAMRNAVEQVVGTFIDSRTLVDKSVVAMDEVFSKAQGYVRSIKIISENAANNVYTVKANIDVDNNSNSALMNKLNMIMLLNDPRIASIVVCRGANREPQKAWRQVSESTINNQLLSMGFNHIVDSSKVSSENLSIEIPNEHTDYIVLCDLHFQTNAILLPKFDVYGKDNNEDLRLGDFEGEQLDGGSSGDKEGNDEYGRISRKIINYENTSGNSTGLKRATVIIGTKIIKTDNQELVAQFTVTDTKLGDTNDYAERLSVEAGSKQIAIKVAEAFSKKATNINFSGQIIARVNNYDDVLNLQKIIESLSGVNKVYIRSYNGVKAKLDIDSSQKLGTVYRMLRENGKVNVFLENMTENLLEISVS